MAGRFVTGHQGGDVVAQGSAQRRWTLWFLDALLGEGLGRNERLDRIDVLIDWMPIEAFVSAIHAADEGRKAYPPLTMVKALLLQQWYGLFDPRLEEALSDTLSFRRFVGLGMHDGMPDHSTISRFRKAMSEQGLTGACLMRSRGNWSSAVLS